MLIVPSDGPIHVYCGNVTEETARTAINTLGDGEGNEMRVRIAREGWEAADFMFLMNTDGTPNPRAGRAVFDLCGVQVTITGPAAFLGLTEYAATQVVQALSI